jgi:hypothetical protein
MKPSRFLQGDGKQHLEDVEVQKDLYLEHVKDQMTDTCYEFFFHDARGFLAKQSRNMNIVEHNTIEEKPF